MNDDDEYVARIRAYVEENKSQYYPDALRARLLADGHDPALVDRVLGEAFASQQAYGAPAGAAAPDPDGWFKAALLALRVVVVAVAVFVFSTLVVSTFVAFLVDNTVTAVLLGVASALTFVGTLFYARWRKLHVWLVAALMFVPLLFLGLLVGACFAIVIGLSGSY